MGHFALTNCKILLDKYDLSGDMNNVMLQRTQADLDNTCFGSFWKARVAGHLDAVFGMAGLIDLTDDGQDEALDAGMSLSNLPMLLAQGGGAASLSIGDRVKFGLIQQGKYDSGGSSGEIAKWTAEGRVSQYGLTSGFLLAVGAKTGTFNGTWLQMGAIAVGQQRLCAQIHATAKSAFTTATFKIQSADDAIGTNATDRLTFSAVTGLVSEHPAPITAGAGSGQQYWRVVCSAFTGTSLTVYIAAGISIVNNA